MTRKNALASAVWVFVALLFLNTRALGQAVFGNISGTVQDATGAVAPEAKITITDIDRGATYNLKSNNDGNYSQTHLLAGHYKMRAEAVGFGAFEVNATVEIDTTTHFDVTLNPANLRTSVSVTDVAPVLTTDRPKSRQALPAGR